MNQEQEELNKIILLEDKIRKLTDISFAKDKYYTDLLTVSVVDRALKLSRGFKDLLQSKNIQCSAVLARCFIDNTARFNGINLFKGKERAYVSTFLDQTEKINNLVHQLGRESNKLTDNYLVKQLDQNHPGIYRLYSELCGYTHLSENHFRLCSAFSNVEDEKSIEITTYISGNDVLLNDKCYRLVAQKFVEIFELFLKLLNEYFIDRHNFPDNSLQHSTVMSE